MVAYRPKVKDFVKNVGLQILQPCDRAQRCWVSKGTPILWRSDVAGVIGFASGERQGASGKPGGEREHPPFSLIPCGAESQSRCSTHTVRSSPPMRIVLTIAGLLYGRFGPVFGPR